MSEFHRPPGEGGLSLDDLNAAFAEMLSGGHDPYVDQTPAADDRAAGHADLASELIQPPDDGNASCEVGPRSILEAMLFVGSADNQPLTSQRVASLMRGVRPAEIDDLVRDMNEHYDADGRPYQIVSQLEGYRLALREEFGPVRDKFLGRARQARLSPAAVEILAIVAYQGSQTADDVARLRGRPSGAILSQLVRRQLLRIERDTAAPRLARYQTTDRFLALLGLQTLEDLPRSQDVERR